MIEGRAVRLGDDVDTDMVVPGAYLNVTDPEELGRHLLETYPGDVGERVQAGDVLVAGANFGMGSSREQAQIALKARGVQAVVAGSFARIFLRNCINVGLPAVVCPEAADVVADGDTVALDLAAGTLRCGDRELTFPAQPAFIADIVTSGGLIDWVRHRLQEPT